MKPVLDNISAFDPRKPYTFKFSYVGNKVIENTLVIRKLSDSDNTTPVYSGTISSNLLQHKILPNVLTNGEQYRAKVKIKDSAGITSSYSDEITFVCFNTPTLSIINTPPVIAESSYIFQLKYDYTKTGSISDILSEYQLFVYHNSDCTDEITRSSLNYTNGQIDDLNCYIQNLENNSAYYIKAFGKTKYDMTIESEVVQIKVEYDKPYIYSVLNAQVIKNEASVLLTSNIISMNGTTNDIDIAYENSDGSVYTDTTSKTDGWVNLDKNNNGYSIIYENNFNIDSLYILQLTCKNIPINTDFLTLYTQDNNKITVKLIKSIEDSTKCYGEMKADTTIQDVCYVQQTNKLSKNIENDYYTGTISIWLQKNDNGFTFKIFE